MSSIFDVPAGLLFVLSLVTTNPNDVATAASGLAVPSTSTTFELHKAPCRHGRQAWYAALTQGAGGAAFTNLAERIFKTSSGRYYVPVEKDRDHILSLRQDNAVSCFIALSSAASNAQVLKTEIKRDVSLSDLYLAHVFGADHAVHLIAAIEATPSWRMASLFPGLDDVQPDLYLGPGARMTLAQFSNRLKRAIKQRVDRASGNVRSTSRKPRPGLRKRKSVSKLAIQPKPAAVRSARDINRRRVRGVHPHQSISARRFDFGSGLGVHVGQLRRARPRSVGSGQVSNI
ncbi:MAG: hypothetical protein K0U34_01480 [Alphaproteobacteria bacterium]|nr:hypothetical protein [Alphaproteobacteria bacterium]